MIEWINRILQRKLYNNEQNVPAFSPITDYENEFPDYYLAHLESIFKQYSQQKIYNFNRYNRLLIRTTLISLLSLFATLIIIFTPLNHYYNILAFKFNDIMTSYTTWWYGLPRWLQIITPSKLIIWSFPHPLTLELIILICIGLYLLISLIRLRISIKEEILLPIYQYMGDFHYSNETNIQNYEFYNALMLPPYDKAVFNEGSIKGDYPDVKIEITETTFKINDLDSSFKPQTPAFIGLLITVHFTEECRVKGHHIFMSSTYNWLERIFAQEKKFNKYGYSGKAELYSSDIEEIKKLDVNGLLDSLAAIEKIITQNNQNLAKSHFDDKLINLFKRVETLKTIDGVDKLIQCAIYEQKLFIMVPSNRELLSTQSVFDNDIYRYQQDIHLILAAIYIAFLFINNINSINNHE